MAKRRMFAKTIIESDAFGDMSKDAQILYIHLGINADDDGFLNNAKSITKGLGMKTTVLDELVDNRFLIAFPSGVVVIKHWRINNYIQKDRYNPTIHDDEKAQLEIKENGAYTEKNKPCIHGADTECIQDGYGMDTQVRLGKVRLGKVKESKGHFVPPTLTEIQAYITEQGYQVDAQTFLDYYESNGWMVGRNHMKDWKATIRRWNSTEKKPKPQAKQTQFHQFEQRPSSDYDAFIKMVEGGSQ